MVRHSRRPEKTDTDASVPRATTVTTTFDGARGLTITPVLLLKVLFSTPEFSSDKEWILTLAALRDRKCPCRAASSLSRQRPSFRVELPYSSN